MTTRREFFKIIGAVAAVVVAATWNVGEAQVARTVHEWTVTAG